MIAIFNRLAMIALSLGLAAGPVLAQEQAAEAGTPTPEEMCRSQSPGFFKVPEDLHGKDVMALFETFDQEDVLFVDLEQAAASGSLESILMEHFNAVLSGLDNSNASDAVQQTHNVGVMFYPALTPEGEVSPDSRLGLYKNTSFCTWDFGGVYTPEAAMWNIMVQLSRLDYLPPLVPGQLEPKLCCDGVIEGGFFNELLPQWTPSS